MGFCRDHGAKNFGYGLFFASEPIVVFAEGRRPRLNHLGRDLNFRSGRANRLPFGGTVVLDYI
jgi:hypothetical protein